MTKNIKQNTLTVTLQIQLDGKTDQEIMKITREVKVQSQHFKNKLRVNGYTRLGMWFNDKTILY